MADQVACKTCIRHTHVSARSILTRFPFYILGHNLPQRIKRLGMSTALRIRPRIDFAIIGFPKCGTTSVHHTLARLDDVSMPPHEVRMRDWARGRIHLSTSGSIVGIKNPNLIYAPLWIAHMARVNPSIRVVVGIRNPVDWLYSFFEYRQLEFRTHRKWMRRFMRVASPPHRITLADVVNQGADLLGASISNGEFDRHLEQLLTYLPSTHIHVFLLDTLAHDPNAVISRICEFLDINRPPSALPVTRNQNAAHYADRALYEEELNAARRHYASHIARLNDLLKRVWHLDNPYW